MRGLHATNLLSVIVVLANITGCSLHLNRPVTFVVRDAETKQPIQGAEISARIRLIDFGHLLSPWGAPWEGKTDSNGKLTRFLDPYHYAIHIDAHAEGYHPERFMTGSAVTKRLLPRKKWYQWRNEFVLEMYAQPKATMDLIFDNGYRGIVLVKFAKTDCVPSPVGRRHFTYEVSPNGCVEIKESGLFQRVGYFDRIRARARDGTVFVTVTRECDSSRVFDLIWGNAANSTPSVKSDTDLKRQHGQDLPNRGSSSTRQVRNQSQNPVEYSSDPKVGADVIALRFVTPVWEHNTWVYVLGTEAEADAVQKQIWGDGNHFNERAFKRLWMRR